MKVDAVQHFLNEPPVKPGIIPANFETKASSFYIHCVSRVTVLTLRQVMAPESG